MWHQQVLKGFEVVGFPKQLFRKILAMCQKGVKVLCECNIRKKLEGGYLNLDMTKFSPLVGRVANDGCWRAGKVVVIHWVKRFCKVVEPGVTMPRAVMVLVWMSFWMAFPKSSAKENAWLVAPVTSGCLGSNLAKKEEVFICKIDVKQACEK
jgi:hypothetical protein